MILARHSLVLAAVVAIGGAAAGCARPAPAGLPTPVAASRLQIEAPKWMPLPVDGHMVEVRNDTVFLAVDEKPAPVAVPVICITRLQVWESGSSTASAARGLMYGTLAGAIASIVLTPEPTLWAPSQPQTIPVVAAGAALGVSIGWSRPGGSWRDASLAPHELPLVRPASDAKPLECTPPAPPSKKKPAAKPVVRKTS